MLGLLRRLPTLRRPRPPAPTAAGDPLADLAALLGRDSVRLDTPDIQRFLADKRVLVTGAGGSIGSEICRQIVSFCPSRLVLIDQSELGLFEIDRELRGRYLGSDLRPVIADVGDATRVRNAFSEHRPHVVFHAAAHKHVGLMEGNPGEAIKVNVLGTSHVADAAAATGVKAFVFISTDKAVNPTGVMGASKRMAERVILAAGRRHEATRFCCVRFGNVLGSSGSVVPIFAKQVAAGGPVTVTHPEMRRFLMTIPEAAGLVMQAGATAQGGEVFVLDMGEPVKILDLAHLMIRRAGLEPGRDISIRFTGVGQGEKLTEELAGDGQTTRPTRHPKIRVWRLAAVDPRRTTADVERLRDVVDAPGDVVRGVLGDCVAEYRPGQPALPPLKLAA